MSLKDDCDCGHDRTHHYFDPIVEQRYCCLAMRCECMRFRAPGSSAKAPPPRPLNHPAVCKCFYCKQHPTPSFKPAWDDLIDEDPPPTTKPIP